MVLRSTGIPSLQHNGKPASAAPVIEHAGIEAAVSRVSRAAKGGGKEAVQGNMAQPSPSLVVDSHGAVDDFHEVVRSHRAHCVWGNRSCPKSAKLVLQTDSHEAGAQRLRGLLKRLQSSQWRVCCHSILKRGTALIFENAQGHILDLWNSGSVSQLVLVAGDHVVPCVNKRRLPRGNGVWSYLARDGNGLSLRNHRQA